MISLTTTAVCFEGLLGKLHADFGVPVEIVHRTVLLHVKLIARG
jgi:hypothetical protein